MALFKSKKDSNELKLPELPSSPAFPELPKAEEHTLPSLPSLPQPRPIPQLPQLSHLQRLPPLHPVQEKEMEETKTSKEGPMFIKIDKFKDAMANFEMIKKKLNESSRLLENIKETRAKEEQELNEWASELNALKEKITQIDKKIFSSID